MLNEIPVRISEVLNERYCRQNFIFSRGMFLTFYQLESKKIQVINTVRIKQFSHYMIKLNLQ